MPNGSASGFTYIGLMIFIAIAGIGLAGTGTIASVQLQREKETQLLFIGEQFSKAIESYYLSTPTALKIFPATFEDLLEDKRFPKPRRHLRQVYFDPMTGNQEWGLILLGGRIIGVHSLSASKPRKTAGFPKHQVEFAKAKNYREWRFTYLDPTQSTANIPTSKATSLEK